MITPEELKQQLPLSERAARTVMDARKAVHAVLRREDHRLLAIVGPCSIHDPAAAVDYGHRLRALTDELQDDFLIVMRTYLEKPRTTVGWRGLIADPDLDETCDVAKGVQVARKLLLDLNEAGIGCASEALDPMLVGYTDDLLSWAALGARTSESQTHRAMASGMAVPVGFKNGTDGGVDVAVDAVEAAASAQTYLAMDDAGRVAVKRSGGNSAGHVVLRGGSRGPNYNRESVARCEHVLTARGHAANILIDCSHANSDKQPQRQCNVLDDIGRQLNDGNRSIVGVMIESHLLDGKQCAASGRGDLTYGMSITDACLGWEITAQALRRLREQCASALRRRPLVAGASGSRSAA